MSDIPIVSYEEVKDLPNHPEAYLFDVRDPPELKETGQIPTSINIPLGELEENLKLSDYEFATKFGRAKPSDEAVVIFHCKMGGRAARAAQTALALGYVNAKSYKGSWTEWAAKEGL